MDSIFKKKEKPVSDFSEKKNRIPFRRSSENSSAERRNTEKLLVVTIAISLLLMAALHGYIEPAEEADSIVKINGGAERLVLEANQEEARLVQAGLTNQYEGIIRFHVIANSDSQEDQALKLKVRDQVLVRIQDQLGEIFQREIDRQGITEFDRAALTRQYIDGHLEEIEGWAKEVVEEEGYDYPVTAALGVTQIPAKEYDGVFFPAGNYEALNIKIGQAAGQNWWCVIFPPLCLIDCGDSILKDNLGSAAGERIILKSRIKELLEKQR